MNKLIYVLNISLMGAAGFNSHVYAIDPVEKIWTADEFWQEGVEWYLDEHKESILDQLTAETGLPTDDSEWDLIKKDVRNLYLQVACSVFENQENKYLFDDQELKYLLDRWFELCQAEGKTAEALWKMEQISISSIHA